MRNDTIFCLVGKHCFSCFFLFILMISCVQDGAAVTGLLIAGASLIAVNTTGNAIYDPIGSIVVGNLLGVVCDSDTSFSSRSAILRQTREAIMRLCPSKSYGNVKYSSSMPLV